MMRFRVICLLLLTIFVGSAAAQSGFSLQQSFGMSSGMNDEDLFNFTVPGFGADLPGFDFQFNTADALSSYNFSQAYSFFRKYYTSTPMPVAGIVSIPIKVDISHKMPSEIYVSGHKMAYSQYTSAVSSSRGNELWIEGMSDWSQYVVCPIGTGIQLIAFTPAGGQAELYEIFQTTFPAPAMNVTSKQYPLYALYNNMYFAADKIGRHILLFIANGQPSNAIIIDVIPAPNTQQIEMPPQESAYLGSNQYTQTYSQQYTQGYSQQQNSQQYSQQYTQMPVPTTGDVPVTIRSNGMRNYQVFLDGAYIGSETRGDGSFSFSVKGGMYHDIRVFDGQFNYPKTMFFESGVPKIIYVEPGTAGYV
ncbi:MAG: hypothetical protein ACE14P_06140 [Methanotrichaceae archaeon]